MNDRARTLLLCLVFVNVLLSEEQPPPNEPQALRISNNHTVVRTRFQPKSNISQSTCTNVTYVRTETNRTYTMADGKSYKVIKVQKRPESDSCTRQKQPSVTAMQRRIFHNVVGNLTQLFPLRWVTKTSQSNDTTQDSQGSATFFKNWAQPSKKSVQKNTYAGDKFKKFLNLFTIVKFDNGGCVVDGLKGVCYHLIECQAKGGRSLGACAKGFGVCCYIERSCGQRTNENCTYFVNDGFPRPSTDSPRVCALVVEKSHAQVKQLRIDFQTFELRGPVNGTCLGDRLIVTGQNTNDRIPDICGVNTGQHMYVDVDDMRGPVNLNVILMGDMGVNNPRTFRMKVTQLQREDELLAPQNCLQYHVEPLGVIQSFNYQPGGTGNAVQAMPGYFNNMNYAICVRKARGFCSVTYNIGDATDNDLRFQMVNVDQDGEPLLPPRQAGAEIFNCPDDYIVVNGVRLCGERLNDATVDVDYTRNAPVTDTSSGPFVLPVKTNEARTGRGFSLSFKQNPCQG